GEDVAGYVRSSLVVVRIAGQDGILRADGIGALRANCSSATGRLTTGRRMPSCPTDRAIMRIPLMSSVNITLPDGSIQSVPSGSRPIDVAKSIGTRLADAALVAS